MRQTTRKTAAWPLMAAAFCVLAAAGRAHGAGSVSVHFNAGTMRVIETFDDSTCDGGNMAGMLVTAQRASGAVETVTWVSVGPDAGEAAGTDWSPRTRRRPARC